MKDMEYSFDSFDTETICLRFLELFPSQQLRASEDLNIIPMANPGFTERPCFSRMDSGIELPDTPTAQLREPLISPTAPCEPAVELEMPPSDMDVDETVGPDEFSATLMQPMLWLCAAENCPGLFSKKCELEEHAKLAKHASFICGESGCKEMCSRSDTLSRHKREQHGKGKPSKFSCEFCTKVFSRSNNLATHKRLKHSQELSAAVVSR